MSAPTPQAAADLFRAEPERYLDVGQGEVAYRRMGTGPDVLFVHGWPVSGATFRTLLPYLAEHVTCHLIDLPSAGSSKFDDHTILTIAQHIESVRRVIDLLGFDEVAVVGHDSGGLIARHAIAGDQRLRALGLINTEPIKPSWRFTSFIAAGGLPGVAAGLGWVAGNPSVRRLPFVLGDAFADSSLLDGEFDEVFLQPLNQSADHREAAVKLLRSFDMQYVTGLATVHQKIDVPVTLVWGDQDPFFPVDEARKMLGTFPNATLEVIPGAGLFSHEEAPEAVAGALLPVLTGTKV